MARALSDGSKASGRWSDFSLRLASAAVLGPVALFCVWYGGWAWDALLLAAMFGLGHEWGRLARLESPAILAVLLAIVWLCGIAFGWFAGLAAIFVLGLAVFALFGRFAALGLPYAGLGGISLLWLRLQPGAGLRDTLFLIAVVWGTDIGAYLVGRVVGGRKLAPRISPGKTVSGAVGGLIIAAAAGLGLAWMTSGADWRAVPVAMLLSLFAQAGDLLESAIKRKLGVKDSGRTIPGHGGLFDRLDGFLAAAPVAAILALCAQGGMALWG